MVDKVRHKLINSQNTPDIGSKTDGGNSFKLS